jgi:hypothetical protein
LPWLANWWLLRFPAQQRHGEIAFLRSDAQRTGLQVEMVVHNAKELRSGKMLDKLPAA